jgi:hypothetical protein
MTISIKTLTALACTAAAPLFIQVRAHCEDPAGWRKEAAGQCFARYQLSR